MFPGLELYALLVAKVMPEAIEGESVRLTNQYLEGVARGPLGIAGQAMAHNPEAFRTVYAEGMGPRSRK